MIIVFALGALVCCGVSGWYSWRAIAPTTGALWGSVEGIDAAASAEPAPNPDAARFNRAATVWNMFAAALGALASLSVAVSAIR